MKSNRFETTTHRAVVEGRPADGDRREARRLGAGRLDVPDAVRPARAVHVDRRSGRVGVGEAGPRPRGRVRGGRRAEALRRGRCRRLVVVHHCWGGRIEVRGYGGHFEGGWFCFLPDRACVSSGVLLFGVSWPFVMSTEKKRRKNAKLVKI